jgi:multidrug efflux pump
VTFFPEVEPEFMQVTIRARDDFSIWEQDALVREVEVRLMGYEGVASVYARTGSDRASDEEVIGTIQLDLADWDMRRPAAEIGADIRAEMAAIPGIDVQVQSQDQGPSAGKPVQLEIRTPDPALQGEIVERAYARPWPGSAALPT